MENACLVMDVIRGMSESMRCDEVRWDAILEY